MAMEDNIKQTNFRVDQQTAEEFRAFCKEMGFSQAQGFDHLIELVELDKAKSVVSTRATEIEDFEHVRRCVNHGPWRPADPVSKELLLRMQQGVKDSGDTPRKYKKYLPIPE